MLITRETDYALRLMRALADGELHKMEQLCESEVVPQQFAYKIMKKLSKAGLAQSLRGREGGCRILCDPEQVTLYDLILAIDGAPKINACLTPGYQCEWAASNHCSCNVNHKLNLIQSKLDEELRSHTLASLF